MNRTMTAVSAGLAALAAPLTFATKAHAAVGTVDEVFELIMQNDAYFYGCVGAGVLTVLMIIVAVAGMGRRRQRMTISAYDNELSRYRQELRRGA